MPQAPESLRRNDPLRQREPLRVRLPAALIAPSACAHPQKGWGRHAHKEKTGTCCKSRKMTLNEVFTHELRTFASAR